MKLEISEFEMEPLSPWCSPVRTRTVGLCIGIFDFLFLTGTFLKSVQFLQLYGFNFFATAAVSSIGTLYAVHILCILACWYGLARKRSSWLVPKIVLKGTTVLICVGLTLILAFFVSSNSPVIGNVIAHGFNAEYYDHRAVIDMACLVIVGISTGLSMAQGWLLVLLINIYRQIREDELERLCEKALKKLARKEKNGKMTSPGEKEKKKKNTTHCTKRSSRFLTTPDQPLDPSVTFTTFI